MIYMSIDHFNYISIIDGTGKTKELKQFIVRHSVDIFEVFTAWLWKIPFPETFVSLLAKL